MTFLVFIATWMVLIFVGIPIAVSMILVSVGYFLYTGIGISFAAQRIVDGLNSFPIIAVPLFILAANIFNSSSITKNLFGFATHLVGHIRGGLGHVNILASLFFSGMSGSAVADAGGLGKIEAEAMRLMNEAQNVLSPEARASALRLKLVEKAEAIIRESVKPMERIEGIKILHVEGLAGGGGGGGGGDAGHGGFADNVVNSALRFRAQAPIVDQLLREIGLEGGDIGRLVAGVSGAASALPPAAAPARE
jgi:hypothetical protein